MRTIMILFLMVTGFSVSAQKENIPTTENFTVEGKVKKGITVSLADLSAYQSHSIDSVVITNHPGERIGTKWK